MTALILLNYTDKIEIMKELIKSGADLNTRDKGGQTALMKAVVHSNCAMVKELIASGADIYINNYYQ